MMDKWTKTMWYINKYAYICAMEYYSSIKREKYSVVCDNVDGPSDISWERQISYVLTSVWNLK